MSEVAFFCGRKNVQRKESSLIFIVFFINIYLFVKILTQNTISNPDPPQVINHEGVSKEDLFYLRFYLTKLKTRS